MKIIAYTTVANQGWTVTAFDLGNAPDGLSATDFSISAEEWGIRRENASRVTAITTAGGCVRMEVEPFSYHGDFQVTGSGAAEGIRFSKEDVSEVKTEWADRFAAGTENGVLYRLYSPEASGSRPLVLFLHGGGECGHDNWSQMVGTLGAARIAEYYPDVYVMAPQAPEGLISLDGKPAMPPSFAESDSRGEIGWHRKYLAAICDIIRRMISEGKVNPDRIYVTGMSMGGAGTLRMLSVGSGLFAAAAPICPSMTPETYGILCSLTDTKLWISTAYVDHTIYRHKYIVDGILKLRDAGNRNARLTLYSPEDLEKYGIAADPNMPLQQRFGENHASWILTYNNENGIMDWLMSQSKVG